MTRREKAQIARCIISDLVTVTERRCMHGGFSLELNGERTAPRGASPLTTPLWVSV
ncbi:hypothetical protein QMY54_04937 [Pseudomonas rhodesiae]|nr:hypothetical protein QMY54_04937 [Pseudomonas rhodesiae]